MSTRLSTYVGPYLECRVEQVPRAEKVRRCGGEMCDTRGTIIPAHADFCHKCGGKVVMADCVVVDDKVNRHDATEAIKEALTPREVVSPDLVHWIPNVDREPPREFAIHKSDAIDLTHLPVPERWWFERAFAGEIETLAGLYGVDNVRVCWGIVAAYN